MDRGRFSVLNLLVIISLLTAGSAQNVSKLLEDFSRNGDNYSTFNNLLSITNVTAEISSRTSLTILAPDNKVLDPLVSSQFENMSLQTVGDFCRYHILLQYLEANEIKDMTNGAGMLVTTLYQTTGRAQGIDGFVNMTFTSFKNSIGFALPLPDAAPSSIILHNFLRIPFNISFMSISQPMIPLHLGSSVSPFTFFNITEILEKGGKFSTFIKLMEMTGVKLEVRNFSDGVSIFAPTDEAFEAMAESGSGSLISKLVLIQYHVVPKFLTYGFMRESGTGMPTLASNGSTSNFLLHAKTSPFGVTVSTGIVDANVSSTMVEEYPLGCYGIDAVLLPQDPSTSASPSPSPSPRPGTSPSPNPNPNPDSSVPIVPLVPRASPPPSSLVSPPAPPTSSIAQPPTTPSPAPVAVEGFQLNSALHFALHAHLYIVLVAVSLLLLC